MCGDSRSEVPTASESLLLLLNPLKGRGREIARVDVDPTGGGYTWDLSPDGMRIALLQFFAGVQPAQAPAGRRIRVIPVDSPVARDRALAT
jgi:hypothetical protein